MRMTKFFLTIFIVSLGINILLVGNVYADKNWNEIPIPKNCPAQNTPKGGDFDGDGTNDWLLHTQNHKNGTIEEWCIDKGENSYYLLVFKPIVGPRRVIGKCIFEGGLNWATKDIDGNNNLKGTEWNTRDDNRRDFPDYNDFHYTYDVEGNILTMAQTLDGKTIDGEQKEPPDQPGDLFFLGYALPNPAQDMLCSEETPCNPQIPEPPTVISLSSFTGRVENSYVILEWITEVEIDNEGFNILRSETEKGPYSKINPYLIPAKGISPRGANYEFVDATVEDSKTYFYKLEDIATDGTSTLHGPIEVTVVEGHGTTLDKNTKKSFWGGGCGFINPSGNIKPPNSGQIVGALLPFMLILIWFLIRRVRRYQIGRV